MNNEESQKALRYRAGLFAGLPKVEGFALLGAEIEKKQERMAKALLARMYSEEPFEALRDQALKDQAFVAGMRYIVETVPAGARRLLAKDVREAVK